MTEPTDKELDVLCAEISDYDDPAYFRAMARAVLAKFGAPPAAAGEPVAWEATVPGYIKYVTQSRYEKFSAIAKSGYKPYKCSNCTTPQPTQAQAGAVPLTRERVKAILTECGYDGASAQHRADFINGLRHGEAAHGIKGGQHGPS